LCEHLAGALEQADDWNLPPGTTATPTAHPARSKITLINLHDATGEGAGFRHRKRHHPLPEQTIKPMGGILVETAQFGSRQRRQITSKISQQLPKNLFRNVRPNQILVSHCLSISSAVFTPLTG
jgi:hypothetical protein